MSLDVLERLTKAFQVEIGDLFIELDALQLGEHLITRALRIATPKPLYLLALSDIAERFREKY